jgi:hypothetical protein
VALVDAALVDQVLHQPAHRVVGEGGDHRRLQAEAPLESAGDVVLAPPFPGLEAAGGGHPPVAGIEAQHHLAEGDQVEAALVLVLDRQ